MTSPENSVYYTCKVMIVVERISMSYQCSDCQEYVDYTFHCSDCGNEVCSSCAYRDGDFGDDGYQCASCYDDATC